MAFEIFIEPELEDLQQPEVAAEWADLCESLGLSGQTMISEKSPVKVGPPYMFVDDKTARIIRTLCPTESNVINFNASSIPVDVLREVKRCNENGWYKKLLVFYDNKSPDPFLIGVLSTGEYSESYHLIARWGAELLPFEVLEQKAIDRLKSEAAEALNTLSHQISFAMNNVEQFVAQILGGKEDFKLDFRVRNLRW